MSMMQITNSPKDFGPYSSEFDEVLVEAVEHALRLHPMIAGVKVSSLYGPTEVAAASVTGWRLQVPTPVAFAALALLQFESAKRSFGRIALAMSREKRELIADLEKIAVYCSPVLEKRNDMIAIVEGMATRMKDSRRQ